MWVTGSTYTVDGSLVLPERSLVVEETRLGQVQGIVYHLYNKSQTNDDILQLLLFDFSSVMPYCHTIKLIKKVIFYLPWPYCMSKTLMGVAI